MSRASTPTQAVSVTEAKSPVRLSYLAVYRVA